jgi:hypothetical protein
MAAWVGVLVCDGYPGPKSLQRQHHMSGRNEAFGITIPLSREVVCENNGNNRQSPCYDRGH